MQRSSIMSPSSSDCHILKISTEVLLQIYNLLDHAPTQIAFSLTCKDLAQVASMVDRSDCFSIRLVTLPAPHFNHFNRLKPLATQQHADAYCAAAHMAAQIKLYKEYEKALVALMPQNMRLCSHCRIYKPLTKRWHRLYEHSMGPGIPRKYQWTVQGVAKGDKTKIKTRLWACKACAHMHPEKMTQKEMRSCDGCAVAWPEKQTGGRFRRRWMW